MKNVALVGLGPHAKRIYINYLKKHKIKLELIIELHSQKRKTKEYLEKNGFKNTKIFTIDDTLKDNKHLPNNIYSNLKTICEVLNITHLIIATEPKAHFMYIEFGLKNDLKVLTDKPIVVTKNMTSLKSIEKVRKQYYEILKLEKESKGTCYVMCQRQYHKGYEEIKKVLEQTVKKYKIPITNIEIMHSDGSWEMPHDMKKENHPYKYGYGKLYHSGYHFIDLLSDFIKINDTLSHEKKITNATVYSSVVTENDEIKCINIEDYKKIFKGQDIPKFYYENNYPKFKKYGEKDYHGLLNFYNKNGFIITTASLTLLHNGISMRNWINTKDFYKSNGRIRHERINITIGHILNIQVHSYQSKEIKDRTESEEKVGGLEHFDIYFFNNPLIDQKPFKEIHLGNLYNEKYKKEFQGYNELSREIFLNHFLNNKECKSNIKDQALSIEILHSCSKGIHNYYAKKQKIEKIEIRNNYTYPLIANRLKNYSNNKYINYESETIKGDIYFKKQYKFYNIINYIPELKKYTVFISINDTKNVAGSLLLKTFEKKFFANLYYKYLKLIINHKNISFVLRLLEEKRFTNS